MEYNYADVQHCVMSWWGSLVSIITNNEGSISFTWAIQWRRKDFLIGGGWGGGIGLKLHIE